ncbi:MAG: class I SAM-dependent methyltransferase [Paracoccaceae bacterium]
MNGTIAAQTPLARLMTAQIRATGPMTVAEFMALALGHPEHGYYTTRDPFGAAGDFITAPEVSQMFGELIGLWAAQVWVGAGRPTPVRLVELGPGRGTLMADALRAAAGSGLAEAAEVWFVETSPVLRRAQAERVPEARVAATLAEIPEGPLLLIANEFLDALPVRQYLASPEGWRERLVSLAGDRLAFALSPPLPGGMPTQPWAEHSPAAEAVVAEIARRVDGDGLAALLIDYGYTRATRPAGPTLQALSGHAPADPLAAPGEADLTWLVDFDALAAAFAGPVRQTTQGAFLAALGIGARAEALARGSPERAEEVAEALERLTASGGMGGFRVLAAGRAGAPVPPGFETPLSAP